MKIILKSPYFVELERDRKLLAIVLVLACPAFLDFEFIASLVGFRYWFFIGIRN